MSTNPAELRPLQIALVPHTHWDREWYEPFQRFRMRLIDVVDDVLVRAKADADFRFTFDGQMAAVEDYLEIRPERRAEFATLVRSGQFAIGPWRVLLDEFLCSGENIIRNLQLGAAQAATLGPSMAVGYLPDMFGHIAQMPQILRGVGLRHACVYRGVPLAVDTHAFRWVSPDGTSIRTEYLIAGYGNVSDLFDDAIDVPGRLDRRLAGFAGAFGHRPGASADGPSGDEVLAMYGTDHSGPLPTLMNQVRAVEAASRHRVRVATLAEYLAEFDPEAELPVLAGELRSHARANILPGVISIRPALKQSLAGAERMVERYAEPLQALWGTAWPTALLELAWTKLVDCSCHDSVTGCGVDETAVQVGARIAEAGQIGQAVRDDATAVLAALVPTDAALVVNPSPRTRKLLVSVDLPAAEHGAVAVLDAGGRRLPAQELPTPARVLADETVDSADLATLFRRVHDRELFGRQVREVLIDAESTPPQLRFELAADPGRGSWDATVQRARVATVAATRPGPWRALTVDEPRRVVLTEIEVPALGFTALRLAPGVPDDAMSSADLSAADGDPVAATESGLSGPGIEVSIAADGTLGIVAGDSELIGVGRIVDGGDAGDSYNYAPPAADLLVQQPDSVQVRVLHTGPLLASVRIRRRYRWPVDGEHDRRSEELVPADVDMVVELRRGEPFVRLTVSFDNQVRDHRLRLHVPCPRPAETSLAMGQFAVVERDGRPESGPVGEFPIATYPASSFVSAGGAAVLLDAPTEYEVLRNPDELAITLLRGAAFLSRNVNAFRDEPAGPHLPTPLGQSPGPRTVRLAVLPHGGQWHADRLAQLAEDFALDALVRNGSATAGGELPAPRPGLELSGDGVLLSSVVAGPRGAIDVRVVALTPSPTIAVLRCPARPIRSAVRVDLLSRELADAGQVVSRDGSVQVALRSFEIATVRLLPAGGAVPEPPG